MKPTLMLVDLPRFMEEILSEALEGAGATVVRTTARDRGDLVAFAREAGADAMVVCRETPSDLASVEPIVGPIVRVPVLAVDPSAAGAVLHHWAQLELADASATAIVTTIAAVTAAADGLSRRQRPPSGDPPSHPPSDGRR